MPTPMLLDDLSEKITDLTRRLEAADVWFAHHQYLTNGDPCPVEKCALCRKGDPPYGDDHPLFKTAATRVDLISRELGELTGIAWSMGYQWDGSRMAHYGDERPQPPATLFGPPEPRPFTTTQVQNLDDYE